MSSDLKDTLEKRLDENYAAFMESLQGKTVSELIAMAPEITAAQQLHEELLGACDEDDAAFLLQFDDPLEVVRGYWEAEITGCDHSDEMGHMLWEIQDRELFPQNEVISTKPKMELLGQDGNIFSIMGRASFLLQMAGMNAENKEMVDRVTSCENYDKALRIISEYVDTELSDHAEPQKTTKKKGKDAYER